MIRGHFALRDKRLADSFSCILVSYNSTRQSDSLQRKIYGEDYARKWKWRTAAYGETYP
jgi:hypothetical protein